MTLAGDVFNNKNIAERRAWYQRLQGF
jgi:hypothetical protein